MLPTRSTFPKSSLAVLVIDVINPLDFPGGAAFGRRAVKTARAIARLADRARRSGVPVIFVNDNLGRWRSDVNALVKFVSRPGQPGSRLTAILRPGEPDFVVLKSTLSGFYETPLGAMLRLGGVKSVIVTGFVTGNCVLFTAADAYMRGFKVVVPPDCVLDLTSAAQKAALSKIKIVLKAKLLGSQRLRLGARSRVARA